MKIGLITFHRAHNFGANLQAFALNKYINDNIAPCEIIDYLPNNQIVEKNPVKKLLNKIKEIIFFPRYVTYKKFRKFQNESYLLSNKSYAGDGEIKNNPPKYDILISGSDQILNTDLTGNSESYYLTFDEATPKISYGSSFGKTLLNDLEKDLLKNEFSSFKALSVREESAASIINSIANVNAQLVLDPVFLLPASQWELKCSSISLPKRYIFVYCMEITEQIKDAVNKVSNLYNIPIIGAYGCTDVLENVSPVSKPGPEDFISCIKNAELVITNSFHGTALSLIFGKNFISVAHSKRNTRLLNIMTLSGEENKLYYPESFENPISDYITNGEEAYARLSPVIEKSKDYLKENLK